MLFLKIKLLLKEHVYVNAAEICSISHRISIVKQNFDLFSLSRYLYLCGVKTDAEE